MNSDNISGMDFDRNVEITGFSRQQVTEYIEKYFRQNESMKSTVLEHITENEDLISFAHIPVLCALLCSYMEYVLKESKSTKDLPITASDLYFEVFNSFRRKTQQKRSFSFRRNLSGLNCRNLQLSCSWRKSFFLARKN